MDSADDLHEFIVAESNGDGGVVLATGQLNSDGTVFYCTKGAFRWVGTWVAFSAACSQAFGSAWHINWLEAGDADQA
jgi:hypothetical protein